MVNIKPVFLSSKVECVMSQKNIRQHSEVTHHLYRLCCSVYAVMYIWCYRNNDLIMPLEKVKSLLSKYVKPLTLQIKQNLLSTLAVRPITLSCEMELIQMHRYFPSFVGHLCPSVSCPQEKWCIWDSVLTTALLTWDSKPSIL